MSRLAPDAIVIALDDVNLVLRPSLRAAYRLNRKFDGFQTLAAAIIDGDLGAMADVVDEAADRPSAIVDLVRDVAINGSERLADLREPLLAYLGQIVGLDENDHTGQPAKPADQVAKTISRTEYYDRLFSIGTGNLGWSPAVTWAASPAEIEAAYTGRLDLLKSIFGSGDQEKDHARQTIPLSERVKATMAALGGKVVKRPKKSSA